MVEPSLERTRLDPDEKEKRRRKRQIVKRIKAWVDRKKNGGYPEKEKKKKGNRKKTMTLAVETPPAPEATPPPIEMKKRGRSKIFPVGATEEDKVRIRKELGMPEPKARASKAGAKKVATPKPPKKAVIVRDTATAPASAPLQAVIVPRSVLKTVISAPEEARTWLVDKLGW